LTAGRAYRGVDRGVRRRHDRPHHLRLERTAGPEQQGHVLLPWRDPLGGLCPVAHCDRNRGVVHADPTRRDSLVHGAVIRHVDRSERDGLGCLSGVRRSAVPRVRGYPAPRGQPMSGRVIHPGQAIVDLSLRIPAVPSPGADVFASSHQICAGVGFHGTARPCSTSAATARDTSTTSVARQWLPKESEYSRSRTGTPIQDSASPSWMMEPNAVSFPPWAQKAMSRLRSTMRPLRPVRMWSTCPATHCCIPATGPHSWNGCPRCRPAPRSWPTPPPSLPSWIGTPWNASSRTSRSGARTSRRLACWPSEPNSMRVLRWKPSPPSFGRPGPPP